MDDDHDDSVEIIMSVEDWPADLAGVRIGDKTFMFDKDSQTVKLYADPIWSLNEVFTKDDQSGE